MTRAVVNINCERRIGSINDTIFGSFIEMIPGSIHGGVYDPASPAADEEGFRRDVMEAARAMGVSIVRFPGGCFAPFYHWRDGVGPRETRPKTRYDKLPGTGEPWWSSSNDYGTDEFVSWCRKVGAEPFICVNMGSGTAEEARDWVEYCNHPGGSRWADLRIRNGHPEPFNVKYWALGNEISGEWEFGYADSAEDYIRRTREFVKVMRHSDPTIKFVLAGTHFPLNHVHKNWNREVLESLYAWADYISMHHYIGLMGRSNCTQNWKELGPEKVHRKLVECMMEVDDAYQVLRQDIRLVNHRKGNLKKTIGIALDEYNPWYKGSGPYLKEIYNVTDAILVAAYFNIFIRNADVATLSNAAQLVNVLPSMICESGGVGFFRQTISYVQEMFLANRGKIAVDAWQDGPAFQGEFFPAVPVLDSSASFDSKESELVINIANRDPHKRLTVELQVRDRKIRRLAGTIFGRAKLTTANDFTRPERLVPASMKLTSRTSVVLPPASIAVIVAKVTQPAHPA
ncbi:MAG: hypothetical protein LLG01_13950 [Planctomycetaceae bacterium]|nr:hypothetical protein [Planctomycetaceae bacterium]